MNTVKVLKSALVLLERPGGWGKGFHWPDIGCYCAMEAINEAAGYDLAAAVPAKEALRAIIGHLSVGAWNDARGRTQAEVTAAFRAAIAGAEAVIRDLSFVNR